MGCGNREYAVVSSVQAAPTSAARLVQGYSGYSMCWRTVPCCPLTIARAHSYAIAAADRAGTCVQYSLRWRGRMAWQLLRKAEVDL